MKYTFLIFLSMIMSGCAVIDSACIETADIVPRGKISPGIELGIGPDLQSASEMKTDSAFKNGDVVGGWFTPVFKLGFGIDDKSDLNMKIWITYNGVGGRVYLKTITSSDFPNRQSVFAPGINFINSPSDKDYFDDPTPIIRTYGFEMPFISTIRMDKRLRFSRILRYGYDRVQIEDISNYSDITSTDLHRFALIGGLSFHPHKTAASLQLNLGIELLTPLTGKYGLMPILGFGLKL